jgi:hypothetical protein
MIVNFCFEEVEGRMLMSAMKRRKKDCPFLFL